MHCRDFWLNLNPEYGSQYTILIMDHCLLGIRVIWARFPRDMSRAETCNSQKYHLLIVAILTVDEVVIAMNASYLKYTTVT